MYLGLDISTSILGWSLVDCSGSLVDYGYIDFKPKKLGLETNLFKKMEYFEKCFFPSIEKYKDKIEKFGAEEAVKKFQGGKSSANTIATSTSFNFGVCNTLYRFLEMEPFYIMVNSARKTVGLKIPSGLDTKKKKAKVVEWCKPRYPSITWPLTRFGNYKAWCGDVADSIVIAEATRLKHE